MENLSHPNDPQSNVPKFSGYDPDKYTIAEVSQTVRTDEALTPGRPPRLTQNSVAKYMLATTRELSEYGPKPTIDELPDAVIDVMVKKDKAFWVDKPGANAYTLHDTYYNYGITTNLVKPTHQDVFPRSYQYDPICVKYRRLHTCDGLKDPKKKAISAQCRDCGKIHAPGLSPFQLDSAKDPGQKRWRDYPDLTASLTLEEIQNSMRSLGRPYRNEACNWYYENYPPVKYNYIMRKFSK